MLTRALVRARVLRRNAQKLDYPGFEEFLYKLGDTKQRLALCIDEFDLVARVPQFDWEFFDNLRSLADNPKLPLTLVVASVMPLEDMAHAGVYGSPFFNIFVQARLGLLSPQEAETLVTHPPVGAVGFPRGAAEIVALAGRHPYFLQLACSLAWDQREEADCRLDMTRLRDAFTQAARAHYQYIWEHSSNDERQTLCDLVHGVHMVAAEYRTCLERGYVIDGGAPQVCGEGLAAFIRDQCGAIRTGRPPILPPTVVHPMAEEHRLALIVGLNAYQARQRGQMVLRRLKHARRDAQAMTELLQTSGFSVWSLLGAQATFARVQVAFDKLHQATAGEPHPDSCFVFYFAGHGMIDPSNDEKAHLLLYDTDPRFPAAAGIDMEQLVYNFLQQVRVPHALVLLDTCHAGFAAGVRGVRHARPESNQLANVTQQVFSKARGRLVLGACPGTEQARELDNLRHGVFTYYLLKHWRDLDGVPPSVDYVDANSLQGYVTRTMSDHHNDLPPPVWAGAGAGPPLILRRIPRAEHQPEEA